MTTRLNSHSIAICRSICSGSLVYGAVLLHAPFVSPIASSAQSSAAPDIVYCEPQLGELLL